MSLDAKSDAKNALNLASLTESITPYSFPQDILDLVMMFFSFSTALAVSPVSWDLAADLGGYNLPEGSLAGIVTTVADWLVGMFVFFGVIGFLVSGIMYLISTGNDDMITKAKKYMTYSIVGVIVGLSGYVIIQAASLMLSASSPF